jgi:hypothetical protein
MVLGFTVLGAMLAQTVDWERVLALLAIYALALGIAAHALDALGTDARKPWGAVFRPAHLKLIAGVALAAAYALGAFYMQRYAPWLWPIAIAEGFLLLAYNLEWFGGRFHSDAWFAFSWGALPALAGYVLQTNTIALAPLVLAAGTAGISMVEIKASRPYKALVQSGTGDPAIVASLEAVLRAVSLGTIAIAVAFALARLAHS